MEPASAPAHGRGGSALDSMVDDPDTVLVAAIARGDRAAANTLVQKHLPRILAVARRMLGERAEAEDVAQDVFLKVWTHAARWTPGAAKFETWMHRVAINACTDRLRRRRTRPLEETDDRPDPGPQPDQAFAAANRAAQVERALQALPQRQRAALVLCHYQGCSNIEAAEILNLSVEAVESLLSRGRRTLKEKLRPLLADESPHPAAGRMRG